MKKKRVTQSTIQIVRIMMLFSLVFSQFGGAVGKVSADAGNPPVITEGDTISVIMNRNGSPTAFDLTLHATDADADPLTWSITTPASHGMADVSGTGDSKSIGYTPIADYFGLDSFIVQVDDGNGGTDVITVKVAIQDGLPEFEVWLEYGSIDGWHGWPAGTQVTLTIDDPSTGPSPDYTDVDTILSSETEITFGVGTTYTKPGFVVTLSDGVNTKSLVLGDLKVSSVSVAADTVSGTADPNASIYGWICAAENCYPTSINRTTTADGSGNWTLDYSVAGVGEEIYDIHSIDKGIVKQVDLDGDQTATGWDAAKPRFEAYYRDGNINAYDWPTGTLLTLDIDTTIPADNIPEKTFTTTVGMNPGDPYQTLGQFSLKGLVNIRPGMTLSMSGAGITKTLVVSKLAVTWAYTDTDIVVGIADPGSPVRVCANNCVTRWVTPDSGTGAWSADYSVAGIPPDDAATVDLQIGVGGWASQDDGDGDLTRVGWNVPNPTFSVMVSYDRVEGHQWPLGETVTVTVDEPGTPANPDITRTAVVYENSGNPGDYRFDLYLSGVIDIKPNFVVTVTHDAVTKTTTITSLTITGFDVDLDTVTGSAIAGTRVDVWAGCDNDGCYNRHVNANGSGVWVADFGHIGTESDEQSTVDIVPGTGVGASQSDEDGDDTSYWQNAPNPNFVVWMTLDGSLWDIHGYQWPLETPVTMTIEDPETPASPDCTSIKTMQDYGYGLQLWFDLCGITTHHPGTVVTLTDGTTTRTHTITSLTVTQVDLVHDIVSGTSDPGSIVNVRIGNADRNKTVAGDGTWMMDFSLPGDNPGEDIADIQPGNRVDVSQSNGGGASAIPINLPNPNITAYPAENMVKGGDFPQGASVTLTIDDPTNGPGTDVTLVGVADQNGGRCTGWCVEFQMPEGFQLAGGQLVTMEDEDGIYSLSYTVSNLIVTTVDVQNDTVSGTADPSSAVSLIMWFRDVNRYITADEDGHWSVDFSIPGSGDDEKGVCDFSEDTLCVGMALQSDDSPLNTGQTRVDWYYNNPQIKVWRENNTIDGNGWKPNSPVNLRVHVPGADPGDDYVTTLTSGGDGNLQFQIDRAVFELAKDHVVTMSDGDNTRTHTILDLDISNVDTETNIVTGTAAAGAQVEVCLRVNGCIMRRVTADPGGNWSADFSVAGDQADEQEYDILWGDSLEANIYDPEKNSTGVEYTLPIYPPCPAGDTISGHVYALNSSTPAGGVYVMFSDFDSDALLFATATAPDGSYSCGGFTPGSYRIWADMGNVGDLTFSRSYYLNNIYENADRIEVDAGTHLTGVDMTYQTPALVYMLMDFNMSRSIPGELAVRQAIAYGLDRQRIINEIAPGSPILDSFVLPGEWSYPASGLPHYDYNAATAASILETSGWVDSNSDGVRERGGVRLHLTIRMRNDPNRIQAANILIENMAAIGIEVVMQVDPNNQFLWTHDFDIALFGRGSDANGDFDVNGSEWWRFKSDNPNNISLYNSAVVDELLTNIAPLRTRAAVLPLVKDVQIEVMTDLATLPLYSLAPAPSANAGADQFILDDPTVTLDGSGSTDPYNDIVLYEWDVDNDGLYDNATGVHPEATFPGDGVYTVGLKVTDVYGMTSTDTVEISIQPPGSMSGTVRDLASNPITGVSIGVTVTTISYVTVAQACTNPATGQYAVDVPQNTQMYIFAGDTQCGYHAYAMEYWQHSDSKIPPTEILITTGAPDLTGIDFTLGTPISGIEYFIFNFDNPIIADPAVRQAIAFGTDRGRILNEGFLPNGDFGGTLQNSYLPMEHWAKAPDPVLTLYPHDREQARTILTAAGWIDSNADGIREKGGQKLTLNFKTTWRASRQAGGEIFKQEMAEIGIEIITEYLNPGIFFAIDGTVETGNFDIAEYTNGNCINAEDETCLPYPMLLSGDSSNYGHYSSAQADLEAHAYETDPTREEKLAHAIQHQVIISQDVAVLPLFSRGLTSWNMATPAGDNISVSPASWVTILFDHVDQAGVSSVVVTRYNPADLPDGFQFIGAVFDVGTSAKFTVAQVCFDYDDSGLTPLVESQLKLYHEENLVWVDVTDPGYPDTSANVMCGTVDSFSPFAVLRTSNQVPVADAGPDQTVLEGETVTLDASASHDPDDDAITYAWDLDNDGIFDDAVGINPEVNFPGAGVYTVELKVTDPSGLTNTDTVEITVTACYTLTTGVNPGGSGSVETSPASTCPGGKYEDGTTVQLTAVPATGYAFTNWSGDAGGSVNPVSVILNADRSVTANFAVLPPTNVQASDGTYTDKVRVTWTASSGATSYKIYRAESSSGTKVYKGIVTGASFNDTTATPGVTYYYWVTACIDANCSDYSTNNTGWRKLLPPTNVQATDGTYSDKVRVTWTRSNGATAYKVYRATTATGTKVYRGLATGAYFDDTTPTPGITYYYWVVAYRSASYSDYSLSNIGWRKLLPPTNVLATDGTYTDKVRVTWTASLGATSYKIYRAESSSGTKVYQGIVTGAFFNDTTATPGITYYYWVVAYRSASYSGNSLSNTGWRKLLPPTNVQASDGTYTDKVRVTWTASSGATSYKVYRAATATGTKVLRGSTTGVYFDDTTATPGVTYYYWVVAYRGTSYSAYSTYNTGWRR